MFFFLLTKWDKKELHHLQNFEVPGKKVNESSCFWGTLDEY